MKASPLAATAGALYLLAAVHGVAAAQLPPRSVVVLSEVAK
jgi:hypothetical protein